MIHQKADSYQAAFPPPNDQQKLYLVSSVESNLAAGIIYEATWKLHFFEEKITIRVFCVIRQKADSYQAAFPPNNNPSPQLPSIWS